MVIWFLLEDTEMGQAIQTSTGNYSRSIYHATVEGGVALILNFLWRRKVSFTRKSNQRSQEAGREPTQGSSLQCLLCSDGDGFLLFPVHRWITSGPFPWSLEVRMRRLVRSGWITTRNVAVPRSARTNPSQLAQSQLQFKKVFEIWIHETTIWITMTLSKIYIKKNILKYVTFEYNL